MPKNIISNSEKETDDLGQRLAGFLNAGDIIALTGELGSGKTTFTKGLARGLGVAGAEYVNSPSFVIVKEYKGRPNLYHFDLYRLDNIYDIEYIGVGEYLNGDGVVVIEWAQKLAGLLPHEYLRIDIKIKDKNVREFNFQAYGKRYDTIVGRYIQR